MEKQLAALNLSGAACEGWLPAFTWYPEPPNNGPAITDSGGLYSIPLYGIISTGDIACYAIVEVENTGNVDLYLKDASFDFEDESGKLLATYSSMISTDPEIVAPGEKGYFYCNMATIKGDITENTEHVFKPALKIEKSKNSIIRYNISDLSISEGDFLSPFNIIGRIDNNTDEDAGLVWIACIIYRDDGTPIAACGTNVTDLAAGQKTSFDLSASHLMNLDIKLSDIAS